MNTEKKELDVLVVDDSVDAAEAMAMFLGMDGYSVAVAHNGEDALEMIKHTQPHCVLLDFGMPGIDGLDLSRTLRELYKDDVVLVAITGYGVENDRVEETFRLVDHHFTKPVSPAQIRKLLPPLS